MTPVCVESTDRRFLIFQTGDALRGNFKFWDNYSKMLEEPGYVAKIFNYLLTRDITGWNPRASINTETKSKMAYLNNNSVYKYISDFNWNKPIVVKDNIKGTDYHIVPCSDLRDAFELDDEYFDPNIKSSLFKKLMLNLKGCNMKKRNKRECYAIELDLLQADLKNQIVALEEI